jgi:hypothetical protein
VVSDIQKSPREITTEFSKAAESLTSAARSQILNGAGADAYRQRLVMGMTRLKAASMKALQLGSMSGIEQLSGLSTKLKALCEEKRDPTENEIFWDVLADHYPPLHPSWWSKQNLPGPLLIKLGAGVLDQLPEPEQVPKQILEMLGDDHFMDGLTMAIERLMPPHRLFDIRIHEVLSLFGDRLADDRFSALATDYLLEHQALFFPVIKRLIGIGQTQPIMSARNPGAIMDLIEQHERDLLGKLDYLPDEIDRLYVIQQRQKEIDLDQAQKSGKHEFEIEKIRRTRKPPSALPTHADLQQINKSLAWPAEFLVRLHEICQNPVIKELALLAFEFPSGNRPYFYLERFGISRKPDWHLSAQEKSSTLKTMLLYEHAIHTDGIELSPTPLSNLDFKLEPKILTKLIRILEGAPVNNPEGRRKAQLLIDALISRAALPKAERGIMEQLMNSAIHPHLLGNHRALRVQLLEDRLGL